MNVERKVLLCYSLGFVDGYKNNIPRNDRLILLDQILIKFNQPPITKEEKKEFLDELAIQIDSTFMISGINRKQQREALFG